MRPSVLALLATSLVVGSTLGLTARVRSVPYWRNPVRMGDEDKVESLPSLDDKLVTSFNHYSGYLQSYTPGDFSTAMFTHYWFVEAHTDAPDAPLLVWLNGGPGTSSLRGLFHENGPFELAEDGKTVQLREFSWNKFANVLYIESPVPVGYSYSLAGEGMYSDRNTMVELLLGLRSFFAKFPKYADSRLYLAGEGYGAGNVFNMAYYESAFDNLAGFIAGNGYLNGPIMDREGVFLAHDHGWVSNSTWAQFSAECCNGKQRPTKSSCDMSSDACGQLVQYIYGNVRAKFGVDPYNIHQDCSKKSANCEDSGPLNHYLDRQVIREALNIPDHEVTHHWRVHRKLSDYASDIISQGNSMLPSLRNIRVPILMYNGEGDLVCSAQASESFADQLGRRVKAERAPWKVDNKTVGSIKQYNGVTLVTVNDAGHSVPREQPKLVFELVKNFVLRE